MRTILIFVTTAQWRGVDKYPRIEDPKSKTGARNLFNRSEKASLYDRRQVMVHYCGTLIHSTFPRLLLHL